MSARAGLPRWSLLAALALVVATVAVVARADPYTDPPSAGSEASASTTPAVQGPPARAPDPRGEQFEDFGEIPGVREVLAANVLVVLTTVGLVLLLALSVFVALGTIPRPRRRRGGSPGVAGADPVDRVGSELAEAVDQALDLLEHGEAREAVVACWLLLIRTAAEAGSPVHPSETSREYAERLATEQLVSADALTRLAELYREARFSRHDVGPDLRAQARRSLGVLQTELRSGVRL